MSSFLSRFIWYVSYCGGILSGIVLMEMSVDRLIVVRFPMYAKTRCTTKRAVRTVVITAVLVFLANLHIFWFYRKSEKFGKFEHQPDLGCEEYSNSTVIQISCCASYEMACDSKHIFHQQSLKYGPPSVHNGARMRLTKRMIYLIYVQMAKNSLGGDGWSSIDFDTILIVPQLARPYRRREPA
jgi:hypothetical protein